MNQDLRGLLPVRVLPGNFMDWFLNITPEFAEEFDAEIKYSNLQDRIIYKVSRKRITDVAEITKDHQIILYENYNQLLWCVCYGLLAIYDEGYVKPNMEGTYTGVLSESRIVGEAMSVLGAGISLTQYFHDTAFFELPNPETTKKDSQYVTKANGIYCGAMTFTLLHEFAHQIYGHVDYYSAPDESKKDELSADDYAISKIEQNYRMEKGPTLKAGVVFGIIALTYLDESLSGDDTHPDLDDRLTTAMEKLDLDEDNHLWGVAALGLTFWAKRYNHNLDMPESAATVKELFYLTCAKINMVK